MKQLTRWVGYTDCLRAVIGEQVCQQARHHVVMTGVQTVAVMKVGPRGRSNPYLVLVPVARDFVIADTVLESIEE